MSNDMPKGVCPHCLERGKTGLNPWDSSRCIWCGRIIGRKGTMPKKPRYLRGENL